MNAEQKEYIEQMYFKLYHSLMMYALSSLKNESLAEEAVQETFRVACTKPADLLASPNPTGWLINTLKNVLHEIKRSYAESNQLLSAYLAVNGETPPTTEDALSLEVVYENVADTDAFKLIKEMAVEGRSHLEMAKARGISVATCRKRVQRAKEILRRRI